MIKITTPHDFVERDMLFYSINKPILLCIISFISFDDSSLDKKSRKKMNEKAAFETNRMCYLLRYIVSGLI